MQMDDYDKEEMCRVLPAHLYDYIDKVLAYIKPMRESAKNNPDLKLSIDNAIDDFYEATGKVFKSVDNMHVVVRRLHRLADKAKE